MLCIPLSTTAGQMTCLLRELSASNGSPQSGAAWPPRYRPEHRPASRYAVWCTPWGAATEADGRRGLVVQSAGWRTYRGDVASAYNVDEKGAAVDARAQADNLVVLGAGSRDSDRPVTRPLPSQWTRRWWRHCDTAAERRNWTCLHISNRHRIHTLLLFPFKFVP